MNDSLGANVGCRYQATLATAATKEMPKEAKEAKPCRPLGKSLQLVERQSQQARKS